MDQLRYNYYKDLINTYGHINKLESKLQIIKAKKSDELSTRADSAAVNESYTINNVHYFDQVEGLQLDDITRELLDSKLEYM